MTAAIFLPGYLAPNVAAMGGVVAPPFSPTDIAGLRGWWMADGTLWQDSARTLPATSDSDPVGACDDASGNGWHMMQATGGSRSTLKLAIQNGKPVLRFGGDDSLANASFSLTTDAVTLFAILKVTAKTNYGIFVAYGSSSAGDWNLRQEGTTGRLTLVSGASNAGAGASGAGTPTGTTADLAGQGFKLLEGSFTAGDTWTIWENGVQKDQRTEAFTQASARGLFIGQRLDGLFMTGDVGEVLIYDSALSDTDRGKVEVYLSTRWGL